MPKVVKKPKRAKVVSVKKTPSVSAAPVVKKQAEAPVVKKPVAKKPVVKKPIAKKAVAKKAAAPVSVPVSIPKELAKKVPAKKQSVVKRAMAKKRPPIPQKVKELIKAPQIQRDEPDAEWHLYKRKCFVQKTTSANVVANVHKLASAIKDSINLSSGDLSAIADIAEGVTLDLCSTLYKSNDKAEVVRSEKNSKGQTTYLLMHTDKFTKKRNFLGNVFKERKYTYVVTFMLLIPKNKIAEDKCIDLIDNHVDDQIDKFEF